ncbi:MAG: MepB family protein [Ottowia sp.]|nr:MepB family protein [Ottowia sp.]
MNLNTLIQNIYAPAGMVLSDQVINDAEGHDYRACRFKLGEHRVAFRMAKITPKKIGQFVTLWKRLEQGGSIEPLDIADPIDFVVVHTSEAEHQGQFIFNKSCLIKKGIFSSKESPGKRAFRVYPPWSVPTAKQAINTQAWQRPYFLPFSVDGTTDLNRVTQLFHK